MLANGMIMVVALGLLIILVGIFVFLFITERKLEKLEKSFKEKESEKKD